MLKWVMTGIMALVVVVEFLVGIGALTGKLDKNPIAAWALISGAAFALITFVVVVWVL